jgi:tetratricopeptide (TPR) repeat protein
MRIEVGQVFGNDGTTLPGSLQIDVALLPDNAHVVNLNSKDQITDSKGEELLEALRKLAVPIVRDVVAFICVATRAGEAVNVLPPFQPRVEPLPPALEAAFRQSEDETSVDASESEPRSGFGLLIQLARRLFRFRRVSPQSGAEQKSAPTNIDPLLGRLSSECLETVAKLSDAELDRRIEIDADDVHARFIRAERRTDGDEHDGAIDDLTRLLQLAPDVPRAYLKRSWCFAERQQLESALRDANQAIEFCRDHPDGYELRGGLFLRLEAWQAAEADFSRCIELSPLRSSFYLWRSEARWYQPERQANAIEDLDMALRLNPNDFQTLYSRLTIPDLTLSDEQRTIYLDRASRYWPPHPQLLVRRAYLHLASAEPEQALTFSAQALELDENLPEAVAIRGMALYELRDFDQAYLDLTKAIDDDIGWPVVYCHRAEILNERQEFESAARDADQAIQLDGDFAPAWLWRGNARGNMHDHEAAKEDFKKARDLAPTWHLPYMQLGTANQLLGDYESACENFSRAIELVPQYAILWLNRGLCRLEQNQEELALDDLNRAIELEPEFAEALAARAGIWSRRSDYQRAINDLTSALELDGENVTYLFQRARCWSQLGEFNRARDDLDELIRLCPGLAPAYSERGYIWTQIGEQGHAESDYREAILCDPAAADQIEIHQYLAESAYHHRHERYRKAIERATAALEIDPVSRAALSLRASAYWYDEELIEAVDDYSKLLELDPNSYTFLSSRGQVYVELKEFDAGLADLDRAIQLESSSPNRVYLAYARSGRALALAGLDRFDEARDEFEASITDCPENAWVHYNHGRVYDKLGEHRKAAICFQLSLTLNDPCLTPRKRERARAYCEKHLPPPPSKSVGVSTAIILCLALAMM